MRATLQNTRPIANVMDILTILQQDYERFPETPTYEIYAENVYFKDPLTEFRGLDRYRQMVGFMATWFKDIHLQLHDIERRDRAITTVWTLSWVAPAFWKPKIRISGRSELLLDESDRIVSHIDYWDCSPLSVLAQHFRFARSVERDRPPA